MITSEVENIPVPLLEMLAETVPVRPGASSIGVCQHRRREKERLAAGVVRMRASWSCTHPPMYGRRWPWSAERTFSRRRRSATTGEARFVLTRRRMSIMRGLLSARRRPLSKSSSRL